MKKIFGVFVTLTFLSLVFIVTSATVSVSAAACATNGDEDLEITLTGGTEASTEKLAFSKTALEAPKNSCVKLVFTNLASALEHDFQIDPQSALNVSTKLLTEKDTTDTIFFMTPDVSADTTFNFWCNPHKANDMKGTFTVLNLTVEEFNARPTASTPGFELALLIFSTISLIGLRKLKNN